MPTTAWLYAGTASGGSLSPEKATGAPDWGMAVIRNTAPLTLGGFGVQQAIGAPPASIDMVELAVTLMVYDTGQTVSPVVAGSSMFAQTAPSGNRETLTWQVGALTWEQLGALQVILPARSSGTDPNRHSIDAVGVRVTYTEAVPITLPPIVGEGRVALAAANLHAVVLPILGEGVVTLAATYLPVGFVSLPIVGEGTVKLTATNLHAVVLPVVGEGAARLTATNLHAVVLPPVEGEGRTRLAAQRLKPTIIRRPPRTVEELIRGSHRRTDHALILTGEHAGERLPIISGDLTLDEAADIRATGTLQLPPEEWLVELLHPLHSRTELAIILGIHGDDGTEHTWQRAIVHATEQPIEVSAEGGLSLSVQVGDRADWVRKAGMREAYAGLGSVSILQHAIRLVLLRAPWLPLGDLRDPGYRSGSDLLVGGLGEDPWEHAVQLAWSVGQRLYIDAQGRLSSQPVTAAEAAEARWVAGEADCQVVSMGTSRSDADVCNVLGVPWEEAKPDDADDTWLPRSGVEWWEDTTSPLGIHGPLGERVRAYSGDSSIIHNAAHARDVAISHGIAQQGALAPLDFAVRADPRLDVGSTVQVVRPELGVEEMCRIATLRYELGGALMGGSMGERRIT